MTMNLLLTEKDLSQILMKDASHLTTNVAKFSSENEELYKLASNTWLLLCSDVCGDRPAFNLRNHIMVYGLVATIAEACALANSLITGVYQESRLSSLIVEDQRETLQVLRYLKKFSPAAADKIDNDSITKFLEVNAHCKEVSYGWTSGLEYCSSISNYRIVPQRFVTCPDVPSWLIDEIREVLAEILPLQIAVPEYSGRFSEGTSAEGSKTVLSKLRDMRDCLGYALDMMYPLGIPCRTPGDAVRICAVPKSYKAARIIAEVPTYLMFRMHAIREAMQKSVSHSHYQSLITLDDQSNNQELARLGSVYGSYSTIDLSSASDSISNEFARKVYPEYWYKLIDNVNPSYIQLPDGSKRRRWMFQTSGNGTTFDAESHIFLAISIVATNIVRRYTGESIALPQVYGDDMVCDDRVTDTLMDLLSICGFTVNIDKSFGPNSKYRESCGVEYLSGLDMSTKYFPRKPINPNTVEGLLAVVSLQHRLYSYLDCEQYLTNYVREKKPNMTSSFVGSECQDLWAEVPFFRAAAAPGAEGLNPIPEWAKRERHLASRTSYKAKTLRDQDILLVETFRYAWFLLHGPEYSDPLSELLGVSGTDRDPLADYVKGVTQWTYIQE